MTRTLLTLVAALALTACSSTQPPAAPAAPAPKVEVIWLGQAAFKITSPGGKVIVTDPWLRMNPLTPAEYKKLESFGKIDVLLVTHGHGDHIADAPALAQMYNVPVRGPGRPGSARVMTLGVLPANLLPRMNKGGTVEAGARHQGDRGACRALVGVRVEEPGHRQGRDASGRRGHRLDHRAGERLPYLPRRRHRGVRRHEVHRPALQAGPGTGADRRQLHDGPGSTLPGR